MFDRKEQAKIYLDRVKSDAKTVNTTLLLFAPVLIFFFLSLGRNLPLVQQRISGLRSLRELSRTKEIYLENLDTYNRSLNTQYQALIGRSNPNYNDRQAGIKSLLSERKRTQDQIARNRTKLRSLNDSLAKQLDQLNFSFELPIIKQKQDFTIRTIALVTMIMLTVLSAYVYFIRRSLLRYVYKTIVLQKQSFQDNKTPPFRNHAYSFPFWFFPIPNHYFLNLGPRIVRQFIGLSENNIRIQNLFALILLLLFIVLNVVLCIANWNINHKAYHQSYSLLVSFGFLLLFTDLLIVYAYLAPWKIRRIKNK